MLLRISFLFLAISALAASAKRPNYHRSAPINPRLRLSSSSSGPNEARDNSAVTCYTNTNAAGYYQDYDDYTSSLGSYDNSFRSACMYGIWMWYDLEDYNYADFNRGAYYAWDEYNCIDFPQSFYDTASSLRYSGAPDGYKYDTLNFYEGQYFMGNEQYFYQDAPQFNIDNLGDSIIVTGCSPWTVYEYDNYQGSAVCFYPADTINCYPGFYRTPDELGGIARKMSSARRGCFSTKRAYPEPVPMGRIQKSKPNPGGHGGFIPEQSEG